jgi:hypothetical protein
MRNSPETADVVCALAQYLRANPLACDSLEGIARWWLAMQGVVRRELEQALTLMIREGLVEQIVAADGRMRYRRCTDDARLQAAIEAYCVPRGTVH